MTQRVSCVCFGRCLPAYFLNLHFTYSLFISYPTGVTDGAIRSPVTPPKACSSSSVSGSEAESTEEESDTTDTDTDFFGLPEIRPPLQTCPKFKKYSVDDFQFIKVLGKGSYGKVSLNLLYSNGSDNHILNK